MAIRRELLRHQRSSRTMRDQPESALVRFYLDRRIEAKERLTNEYSLKVVDSSDFDVKDILENLPKTGEPYEYWKVAVPGHESKYVVVLAMPCRFPDQFPRIYLSNHDYHRLRPLPHLSGSRNLCTRDPEVCVLNEARVGDGIVELLKIAVQIIEAGIDDKNREDVTEEFLAYWNDTTSKKTLALFDPADDVQILKRECNLNCVNGHGVDFRSRRIPWPRRSATGWTSWSMNC